MVAPPSHPLSHGEQAKTTWADNKISGNFAFLIILILSLRADVAAYAQHDPQY